MLLDDSDALADGQDLTDGLIVLAHPFQWCEAEIFVDQAQVDAELPGTMIKPGVRPGSRSSLGMPGFQHAGMKPLLIITCKERRIPFRRGGDGSAGFMRVD